ncbi:uncharacterized protein UTRI_00284 [Ustilago trichophora]|uniref:BZIP domain-containing protein n=1 Tax=Ustilago trichophora TaxID=86804 RepID=A0A5C3DTR4_9BASI|nr:uncharacterized protein UTRI_00284 [Ustilago trichophora]
MSSTPPSSSKGQQRTRNAQAQADLRARRKAYIKSLEDTVSSLEACVRSLRAQNSDLLSSSSSSSSSSPSSSLSPSSSFACKNPQSPSNFCDEVDRLKGENARLHTLLAEAGLAAAAATRLAKMGKDSPLHESEIGSEALGKSKTVAKSGKAEGENWSNTSSITTKKRKLTKMQAFAKDVDSQIHSLPSSSTPLLGSAAVEPQNTLTAFESGMTTFEHPDQQAIHAYMSSTPSASSSSRASVVSHRSPKTPRFDTTLACINQPPLFDTILTVRPSSASSSSSTTTTTTNIHPTSSKFPPSRTTNNMARPPTIPPLAPVHHDNNTKFLGEYQ